MPLPSTEDQELWMSDPSIKKETRGMDTNSNSQYSSINLNYLKRFLYNFIPGQLITSDLSVNYSFLYYFLGQCIQKKNIYKDCRISNRVSLVKLIHQGSLYIELTPVNHFVCLFGGKINFHSDKMWQKVYFTWCYPIMIF